MKLLPWSKVFLVALFIASAFPSLASAERVRPAVIGGQPASEQADSAFVRLQMTNNAVCTGTLISQKHIISAAHCLYDDKGRRLGVTVWWGSNYYHSQKQLPLDGNQVRPHPSFRIGSDGFYNDFALISLKEALPVQTLPLYGRGLSKRSEPVTVFGWGVTETWNYSDRLLTADVTMWSRARCARFIRSYGGSASLVKNWLCGGDLNGGQVSGARSICWGDSGGPLVQGGRVIGVLSWLWPDQMKTQAAQCVSSPAFYTRLTPRLMRWLNRSMG